MATPAHQFSSSVSNFASLLWDRLDLSPGENAFFSPISVHLAILLAANGADGQTLSEILEVMSLSTLSMDAVNGLVRDISGLLNSLSDPSKSFVRIANSIWLCTDLHPPGFHPTYVEKVSGGFGASVHGTNSGSLISSVNSWCGEKTEGKITEILPPKMVPIPPLVLVNAVYFKGSWENKFNAERTAQMDFFETSASSKPCYMMTVNDKFHYTENDRYQAIRLPYQSGGGCPLDAVVVLPRPGMQVGVESTGDAGGWEALLAALALTKREGTLSLPRFKVESSFDVTDQLQNAGIRALFSDPTGLTPMVAAPYPLAGLQVDKVLHKVFIEVNEEGTEAAAVTAVVAGFGCAPSQGPPPFQMTCNRPFMFYVCERSYGLPLFLGAVNSPGLQGEAPSGNTGSTPGISALFGPSIGGGFGPTNTPSGGFGPPSGGPPGGGGFRPPPPHQVAQPTHQVAQLVGLSGPQAHWDEQACAHLVGKNFSQTEFAHLLPKLLARLRESLGPGASILNDPVIVRAGEGCTSVYLRHKLKLQVAAGGGPAAYAHVSTSRSVTRGWGEPGEGLGFVTTGVALDQPLDVPDPPSSAAPPQAGPTDASGGGFGPTNTSSGGLFRPTNTSGGGFGPTNTSSGGLFGPTNTSGGGFGPTNTSSGGLFGPTNTSGGGFGPTNTSGGGFGPTNTSSGGGGSGAFGFGAEEDSPAVTKLKGILGAVYLPHLTSAPRLTSAFGGGGYEAFEEVHAHGVRMLGEAGELIRGLAAPLSAPPFGPFGAAPPTAEGRAQAGARAAAAQAGVLLAEAGAAFRAAEALHQRLPDARGGPCPTAHYNLACALSLAAELQLRAAPQPGPGAGSSGAAPAADVGAPGGLRAVLAARGGAVPPGGAAAPALPPAGPAAGFFGAPDATTLAERVALRLGAAERYLRVAAAAGFQELERAVAGDADLRALREVGPGAASA